MSKPNVPKFPASFILLQQEGYLMSSCLSRGLTDVRIANVNKGILYSGFFNLSIGIERLLKVIIVIDHMLQHDLSVPTKKQMKAYGHDIVNLYDTCVEIGKKRYTQIQSRSEMDVIDHELLSFLSDFAITTRYHNLDALSKSQSNLDPLLRWNNLITSILDNDVSAKQRDKIIAQAKAISTAIDDVTFTFMHGLDQNSLTTTDVMALPGLHNQAARFAVLRLIKKLSTIRDLLANVSHEAYNLDTPLPPFPQMQEFLQWLWDDRQYVLNKKKWP